ncbi:hypothetical protein A2Z33_03800 [Candidatus Gottesmanbacteria bacterium RBG_16_52_11]|uniref:Uncharacterized protein n=1 Tax=Candidatus Gottesmanbacteria bacterium RBG_16_52_11 TaxID=1798374 RepID=A0A1F5YVV0_9BACT|nr:MAG: hypothetical protein A2Z33_03800 [Candidatus Gottesmanbacteria bacterium RBG_16_52_11]
MPSKFETVEPSEEERAGLDAWYASQPHRLSDSYPGWASRGVLISADAGVFLSEIARTIPLPDNPVNYVAGDELWKGGRLKALSDAAITRGASPIEVTIAHFAGTPEDARQDLYDLAAEDLTGPERKLLRDTFGLHA